MRDLLIDLLLFSFIHSFIHSFIYFFNSFQVCSDMNKPNGQYLLPPVQSEILDFTWSLSIRNTI